ncbi:hypothetical protein QQP08_001511 [Theobroma cacao]|nr:hypothetical protein QQP08_001511 [Theobroma cacao]
MDGPPCSSTRRIIDRTFVLQPQLSFKLIIQVTNLPLTATSYFLTLVGPMLRNQTIRIFESIIALAKVQVLKEICFIGEELVLIADRCKCVTFYVPFKVQHSLRE